MDQQGYPQGPPQGPPQGYPQGPPQGYQSQQGYPQGPQSPYYESQQPKKPLSTGQKIGIAVVIILTLVFLYIIGKSMLDKIEDTGKPPAGSDNTNVKKSGGKPQQPPQAPTMSQSGTEPQTASSNDTTTTSSRSTTYSGTGVSPTTYVGCYADAPNAYNNKRFLDTYAGMKTVEECDALTKAAGAKYFGMQYWQGTGSATIGNKAACYYSTNSAVTPDLIKTYTGAPGNNTINKLECDTATDGNKLGGPWVNALYSVSSSAPATRSGLVPDTSHIAESKGCFSFNDKSGAPFFNQSLGTSSVENCNTAAKGAGVAYFGMTNYNTKQLGKGTCYYSTKKPFNFNNLVKNTTATRNCVSDSSGGSFGKSGSVQVYAVSAK